MSTYEKAKEGQSKDSENVNKLICVIEGFAEKSRIINENLNSAIDFWGCFSDPEDDIVVDDVIFIMEKLKNASSKIYDTGNHKWDFSKNDHIDESYLSMWYYEATSSLKKLRFFLFTNHPKGVDYCEDIIQKALMLFEVMWKSYFSICVILKNTDSNKGELLRPYLGKGTYEERIKNAAFLYRTIDDLELRKLAGEIETKPPETPTDKQLLAIVAPITLTDFLKKHCGQTDGARIKNYKDKLTKAAKPGKNGNPAKITLPEPLHRDDYESGQAYFYPESELLNRWPTYCQKTTLPKISTEISAAE